MNCDNCNEEVDICECERCDDCNEVTDDCQCEFCDECEENLIYSSCTCD